MSFLRDRARSPQPPGGLGVVVRFEGGPVAREAVARGCEQARERGAILHVEGVIPARLRWQIAVGSAGVACFPGLTEEDIVVALATEIESAISELPADISVRWRIVQSDFWGRSVVA